MIKIGILTLSDRASAGGYEDLSGKAIIDTMNEYLISKWEPIYKVIPDNRGLIEETLKNMADTHKCCLIVTTGGTGPDPKYLTPEATEEVCDKMMPGKKNVRSSVLSQQVNEQKCYKPILVIFQPAICQPTNDVYQITNWYTSQLTYSCQLAILISRLA